MEKNTRKNTKLNNEPWKAGDPSPNPNGRPKGQRNYATIYREALINIGKANGKTAEQIETMMEEVGLKNALKGNYSFFKDVRDRIHGQATQKVQGELNLSGVEIKVRK